MAVKRQCVCCGEEYEYCPNCEKVKQPLWRVTFCSEKCKDLFNMVSAYNTKRVGKAQLQSFIAEHGINEASRYTEPVKKVLMENNVPEGTYMVESPLYRSRRRRKKSRNWNFN